MPFKERSLNELAEMICGNFDATKSFFRYRSSSFLTEFFRDCGTDYTHDGSASSYWVAERRASEDELIQDVLLPLFRQLGFHRITPAGHKDKALEYGKDVWMKHTLPTTHVLYLAFR